MSIPPHEKPGPAAPAEGLPQPPPAPVTPPGSRPVAAEEVDRIRRWLWVAAIWALAVPLVALLAVVEDRTDEPARPPSTRVQVEQQPDLSRRLKAVESRIRRVEALGKESIGQLKRTQDGFLDTRQNLNSLARRIQALEERRGGGHADDGPPVAPRSDGF